MGTLNPTHSLAHFRWRLAKADLSECRGLSLTNILLIFVMVFFFLNFSCYSHVSFALLFFLLVAFVISLFCVLPLTVSTAFGRFRLPININVNIFNLVLCD